MVSFSPSVNNALPIKPSPPTIETHSSISSVLILSSAFLKSAFPDVQEAVKTRIMI